MVFPNLTISSFFVYEALVRECHRLPVVTVFLTFIGLAVNVSSILLFLAVHVYFVHHYSICVYILNGPVSVWETLFCQQACA